MSHAAPNDAVSVVAFDNNDNEDDDEVTVVVQANKKAKRANDVDNAVAVAVAVANADNALPTMNSNAPNAARVEEERLKALFNPPVRVLRDVLVSPTDRPAFRVTVVQDGELPGGSKQRALYKLLMTPERRHYREFVYASPTVRARERAFLFMFFLLLSSRCLTPDADADGLRASCTLVLLPRARAHGDSVHSGHDDERHVAFGAVVWRPHRRRARQPRDDAAARRGLRAPRRDAALSAAVWRRERRVSRSTRRERATSVTA